MNTFEFPTLSHLSYRLWRLRRLIVVGALIPIIAYLLVALIRWGVTGYPPSGVFAFGFLCLVVVAIHAVLFPNATTETGMISLGLAFLVIAAPLAGNSILGWAVLILIAVVAAIFGQNRLLGLQMGSKKVATVISASVRTNAAQEQAMQAFGEVPERAETDRRSGAVDEDGMFPVFLTPQFSALIEGLDEEFDQGGDSADFDGEDIEHTDALEELEPMPSYWVRIEEQTDDYQKATIFLANGLGGFEPHSTNEIRIEKAGKGFKITETETLVAFEQGMSLGMWITEFQKDGMVMRRDRLEGLPEQALRTQHQDSLLMMLGRAFMRRLARRGADQHDLDSAE